MKMPRGFGGLGGLNGALDFAWPLLSFRNATTNIQAGDLRMHFKLLVEM
jgi:hypothetical protein